MRGVCGAEGGKRRGHDGKFGAKAERSGVGEVALTLRLAAALERFHG